MILAYPDADNEVRDFLMKPGSTRQETESKQLVFLIKLYEVAAEYLMGMQPNMQYKSESDLALEWKNYINANDRRVRQEMYKRVVIVCPFRFLP